MTVAGCHMGSTTLLARQAAGATSKTVAHPRTRGEVNNPSTEIIMVEETSSKVYAQASHPTQHLEAISFRAARSFKCLVKGMMDLL